MRKAVHYTVALLKRCMTFIFSMSWWGTFARVRRLHEALNDHLVEQLVMESFEIFSPTMRSTDLLFLTAGVVEHLIHDPEI